MKRLIDLIKILQVTIIAIGAICTIEWSAAWVMLIFNQQIALKLFISAGISFAICVLLLVIWSACLRAFRKKAINETLNICEEMKRKAQISGDLKVSIYGNDIVWIIFSTIDVGVLSKKEIISDINTKVSNELLVIYEEVLKTE